MKRLNTDICNLESRMRKEAANELHQKLRLQNEYENRVAKRIKVDDSGETLFTRESLPSNIFHLGGDNYVSIVFFLSHTRVHIRRYSTDEEGFLHPSKNGVSLSPSVWHSFVRKSYNFAEQVIIIDKDLCITREIKDEGNLYIFQRMFQRRNLSYQFLPENVILTGSHMAKLQDLFSTISVKVKECLIQQTLAHFVSLEHIHVETEPERSNADIFCDFHDYANLTFSLKKCLTKLVSEKICELFDCFACKADYPKSNLHACITFSPTEKFEGYFELAFYKLDFRQLAKDFYHENVNDFTIVPIDNFFSTLDVSSVLKDIKKMYVENEETVFDNVTSFDE